ncbi:MAG: Sua5/YciO/YrdC/YwlC family protein, partial [Smithellaceae bacterium]|nr:Sua5/YciO/YrdC/YwlC family protein [Smithellaceae bacterium]
YTPLHHLLLAEGFAALVMTSANQTDEPISIGNREAIARLEGIADYFLIHNRDILVRCDDSVATVVGGNPYLLRRSRGYAPKPIRLQQSMPSVLALGGHMKAALCILRGDEAFLSPHVGDMETPQARDFFHENIVLLKRITETSPAIVACDLHPAYYSTQVALKMEGVRIDRVQHHHAHIVSCLAENGMQGPVIGLSMDGTGYGTDGTIWGGEFLVADTKGFQRVGHLCTFQLPGGEKAIHEPWRTAAALLVNACGRKWRRIAEGLDLIPETRYYGALERMLSQGAGSPVTSSLGRLFDGVAAILGIRRRVSFEGQAAMELEGCSLPAQHREFPYEIEAHGEMLRLDLSATIRAIAEEYVAGVPAGVTAGAFHETLVAAFVAMTEMIRERTGIDRVALSGGCFQNRILLEGCLDRLPEKGFKVFRHRLVPANDGGIALGQAVCAAARCAG